MAACVNGWDSERYVAILQAMDLNKPALLACYAKCFRAVSAAVTATFASALVASMFVKLFAEVMCRAGAERANRCGRAQRGIRGWVVALSIHLLLPILFTHLVLLLFHLPRPSICCHFPSIGDVTSQHGGRTLWTQRLYFCVLYRHTARPIQLCHAHGETMCGMMACTWRSKVHFDTSQLNYQCV